MGFYNFWTAFAPVFAPNGSLIHHYFITISFTFGKTFFDFCQDKRGGGYAALLRFGSAPGPKAPSCVSGFFGTRSLQRSVLTLCRFSFRRLPSSLEIVGSLRPSGAASLDRLKSRLASRTSQDAVFRPKTPQDASKTLQDASKTIQDEPKTLQDRPRRPKTHPRRSKTPPRRSKTPPGRPQDASKTAIRRTKTAPRRPKTPQDGPKRVPGRPKRPPGPSPEAAGRPKITSFR